MKRFWDKIEKTDTCWFFRGALNRGGYGVFQNKGAKLAHRTSYELLVGPIPPNFVLDHLCRNRQCVNPGHLEMVTQKENLFRGNTIIARRAFSVECSKGHMFTEQNTYRRKNGTRKCKTCHAISENNRYHKKTKA